MRRGRQRGAVLAMVLAIIAIILVAMMANYALSRLATTRADTGQTARSLAAAVEAIEQYAATAQRLPCPANGAVDDGIEVPATAATCTFPDGTLPWRTIGMRRDDAFDPWGRKISYRVYTGNKGSLTQPGGISMVECDTVEPGSGATTGNGADQGRCVANANPHLRSTSAARFLAGKGLSLSDNGVAREAAYVVISHGATGLGGFTTAGMRLAPDPTSDERNNTRADGPFTVKAFSDVETKANAASHFDDLVAYRTIAELVNRIGLQARDWPEADPTVTTALTFDAATLYAATGTTPSPATPLANSIDFGNAVVTGRSTDTSTPNPAMSFASGGGGGVGVGGTLFGTGFFAYINNMLTNFGGEYLDIKMVQPARKFAITLNDENLYSTYGLPFKAELRFYKDTTVGTTVTSVLVQTVEKFRCGAAGSLASYSVDVSGDFNRVEVVPVAPYLGGLSAFLVSEIKGCSVAATACKTNIALAASPANATDCP